MQKRVLAFIKEHGMLEQGDRIVVGVSGGADSVCLLQILCELREAFALELFAVHVNHGLRQNEAERDEQFTVDYCEKLGVPCRVVKPDVRKEAKECHLSEEEAGRELRYLSFRQEAERLGCTKIAVAHHMEDNAETLLFRMFRGTGISGLSGIAPVSLLQHSYVCRTLGKADKEMTVIRPLLCVSRTEVEAYLLKSGQAYCEDSTNKENVYSRNRIRNEILPVAGRYINAQSVRNLNALAKQARAVNAFLEHQAEAVYERCVTTSGKRVSLALKGDEEPVLLELVLRRCLFELAGKKKDISAVHIEALCELYEKQVGSRLDLPYGIRAKRSYEGLLLCAEGADRSLETQEQCRGVMIEKEQLCCGTTVMLPDGRGRLSLSVREMEAFGSDAYGKIRKIAQNDYTKCFDYDNIKGNISVRTAEDSDYLCIHPDGGHKSLKDFFVDAKVPLEERNRVFFVAEEDMVLWIPGMRTGENRRVSNETKRVLLIEWNI